MWERRELGVGGLTLSERCGWSVIQVFPYEYLPFPNHKDHSYTIFCLTTNLYMRNVKWIKKSAYTYKHKHIKTHAYTYLGH